MQPVADAATLTPETLERYDVVTPFFSPFISPFISRFFSRFLRFFSP